MSALDAARGSLPGGRAEMSHVTPKHDPPSRPAHPSCADAIVTFETFRDLADGRNGSPGPSGRAVPSNTLNLSPFRRFALRRADFALAAVLFIAALAARAPLILRGETLLHSDEAIVGLMAQDISEGTRFPIYFYGQRYMGAMEAYVIAALLPIFANPIHALRTAPALFFAAMVAAQFLMLTRWFGRKAGLIGAAVLLCGPPMFAQWTISARGAYVENLLWGTLILWAYAEWFAAPVSASNVSGLRSASRNPTARRQFAFGTLVGLGLWLNPSVVFFLAPITVHFLLGEPLRRIRTAWNGSLMWRLIDRLGITALPVVAVALLLLLNVAWSVQVDEAGVKTSLLLGLVPRAAAVTGLFVLCATVIWRFRILQHMRAWVGQAGAMLLGLVVGSAPAIAYVVLAMLRGDGLEPTLPLGLRPLWTLGDTLVYFIHGLPIFFGADPQPFLRLVTVGQDAALAPMDLAWAGIVGGANWIVFGAAITALMVLLLSNGPRIGRLLRLQPDTHRPVALLALGAAGCIGLYLVGGCSFNFTTIRYWLPIWVFLPGLLAVACTDRRMRTAGRGTVFALCAAWVVGQVTLCRQVGASHPLQRVADALVSEGVTNVWAEPLDAHVLTYLTRQSCRAGEYRAFWARFGHHDTARCTTYLVRVDEPDREWDWINGGFPGSSPPETKRNLWPDLRRRAALVPHEVVMQQTFPDGYILHRLERPLANR